MAAGIKEATVNQGPNFPAKKLPPSSLSRNSNYCSKILGKCSDGQNWHRDTEDRGDVSSQARYELSAKIGVVLPAFDTADKEVVLHRSSSAGGVDSVEKH